MTETVDDLQRPRGRFDRNPHQMVVNGIPNLWKTVKKGDSWAVQTADGKTIATISNTGNDQSYAKIIAAAPYMLETLKSMSEIIGEEDLPDNGDLSGAAVSDMIRAAVSLAE